MGLSSGSSSNNNNGNPYALQDTSVVFGALTPVGFGAVRLSAQDVFIYAASYKGLGLLPNGTTVPAFWRVSPLANTSAVAHWVVPSGLVPEGVNATTPTPSKNGSALGLNAGPYVFLVEAFNTLDGNATSSAYLTIVIQPGAVSVGTYDTMNNILGKGVTPQTFAGDTILLSTGINRADFNYSRANGFFQFNFPHNVTIRNADPDRPGGISTLGFNNCSNIIINGLLFTGDLGNVNAPYFFNVIGFGGGSNNMIVMSSNITFNGDTCGGGSAIVFGGCTNCAAIDVNAFGVSSGIVDDQNTRNTNILVSRFRIRQYYNNAFFIGNSDGMTVSDCVTMAAMRLTAFHIDNIQFADGAAPQNFKLLRHQLIQAEGNAAAQGLFAGTPGLYYGFIDDNSSYPDYSGKVGKTLTITNVFINKPLVPFTRLAGDQFSGLVQVITAPPGDTLGQYQLDITTPMKAPPGNISTAPFTNFEVNGWVYVGYNGNGMDFRGIGGTSSVSAWTNTRVAIKPWEVAYTYFTATISGATMVVTGLFSEIPLGGPMIVSLANGTSLVGSGNPVILSGPVSGGVGTYTLEAGASFSYPIPTTFRASEDIVIGNEGPSMNFKEVDVPSLWNGNSVFSSGYMYTSYPHGKPAYLTIDEAQSTAPPSISFLPGTTVFNTGKLTFALPAKETYEGHRQQHSGGVMLCARRPGAGTDGFGTSKCNELGSYEH